jgi:predicted cupin superfamily sugar epimerase
MDTRDNEPAPAMLTAQEIIKNLRLEAHPAEGGFFRQTYRS